MIKFCRLILLAWLLPLMSAAQEDAPATGKKSQPRAVRQRFHRKLPPGNYSGICPIGDGRYAVVDDKAEEEGFYIFRIDIDSIRGRITAVENEGYRSSHLPNRDMEGICFRPSSQTLFISGEKDNEVYEYRLDGQRTGRRLAMPAEFALAGRNYGLESLTYDSLRHRFYTTTERPLPSPTPSAAKREGSQTLRGDSLLHIQTFGDDLQPGPQYLYRPDAPLNRKYFHGVTELCALADGRLLVVERQLRVPRLKVGARSVVRIYETWPDDEGQGIGSYDKAGKKGSETSRNNGSAVLQKRLVAEIKGRGSLTRRSFANYEALCEPMPGLLLLMADSQDRYRGVLRDWLLVVRTAARPSRHWEP